MYHMLPFVMHHVSCHHVSCVMPIQASVHIFVICQTHAEPTSHLWSQCHLCLDLFGQQYVGGPWTNMNFYSFYWQCSKSYPVNKIPLLVRVSCVICHVSYVMCQVLCIMHHVSFAICHMSCVICHVSCVIHSSKCYTFVMDNVRFHKTFLIREFFNYFEMIHPETQQRIKH